ncbi:MAG: PDZ domain-containing protein [Planctomycetes bacterium]|nr:PDZ domain-containing protein [Planctomycetota bacterium]
MRHFLQLAVILPLVSSVAVADAPNKDDVKPITVPFELLKTQHMVVNIKVNGKGPYRVIFDTGAPINLLNNKVAKEADIIPKKHPRPWFAPFGSMGQFKIKSLQVGDVRAENMDAMVMDHPTVGLISKFMGPIEGIVGFSFFGQYRTTIDYQKKVMTFVPTSYRPPDMMDNMMKMLMAPAAGNKVVAPAGQWGFRIHKNADDTMPGVNVKEVMTASPAANAGLQAGDRLLTLAGRWTDTVGDCYLAASQIQPGTEAVLRVLRDGKTLSLKVRVASGI